MIPLSKPYFDARELACVEEVLQSGWVAGQGPKGKQLADLVKEKTGSAFAIPVNNCTAALHLALLAIGIKQGDEVLVSDFTFPATGHAVMYCNAKPLFIDVKSDTYNLDPDLLKANITEKTRAIIVVHALGQMADMDPIMKIAEEFNLKVIEDAACAFGATYKNQAAGSIADIGAFSFHARKNTTCGEGGMITTNNEEFATTISSLSCFGMESALNRQGKFSIPTFNSLGYNYKLSDINAAIVIEQIYKYPDVLKKRREMVALYNSLLNPLPYLTIPLEAKDCLHVYQTYAVVLDDKINRNDLVLTMKIDGIQTQIGTYSSFIQPVYNSSCDCPNSLHLFNQSLALPLFHEMTEENVHFVVEKLIENIKKQID